VVASVATEDAMVAVGVCLHFELNISLDEFLTQLGTVLVVHVVVCQSMADEEIAM
jgi:hypothetical protein